MLEKFVVRMNEKGILMRDGDFRQILGPGRYRFLPFGGKATVSAHALDTVMPAEAVVDYLLQNRPAEAEAHFIAMTLNNDEAGLRFENDVLVEVLPPGARRFLWKGLKAHRLERFNLDAGAELPAGMTIRLNAANLKARAVAGLEGILVAQVPAYHVGVLRIDGQIDRLLEPGLSAFWRFNRDIQLELVDTRLQVMEVSGQEILTKDRVGLRLNLVASWRFTDVAGAFAAVGKPADYLYRELQFGLRAAVGTRSIDAILENKQDIDEMVTAHVKGKLAGFGIEVASLGVRDIVLPGEMKDILARVVEAEKAAEANVIRRREETAATRSLLNTAKVMEDNPVALRLKELETLERVAERIDRISVFGGLDQVLNGLVSLKAG
ncbi:MAG: slipin family protein [Zoogloeaceae bacterium]|jgi:regulator of protease activity HflC (stomatin/prohibitin superfamily)|nr:slipin family protein [Zoogloeaceae bacterium]